MSTPTRPDTVVNMPLVFSENDTFALAELLATVAKEEPITYKQKEFAAMLFVRMDRAANGTQRPTKPAASLRADLRPAPIFNRKNKRRR